MAIKFKSYHNCEKCGKRFEWGYNVPVRNKLSETSNIVVESRPVDLHLAHNAIEIESGKYIIEVNCPFCDFDNRFEYDE